MIPVYPLRFTETDARQRLVEARKRYLANPTADNLKVLAEARERFDFAVTAADFPEHLGGL